MTEKKTIIVIYIFSLLGILAWLGAILLAPYFKSQSIPESRLLYGVFSRICHQAPSRCFYLFGFPLAVCTRCLGIYLGFLSGIVFFPFIKGFKMAAVPPSWLFIFLTFPIAVDTGGNFLSLWSSPDWLRFVFGLIWGSILPFYFVVGLSDFFTHLQKKKKRV